MANQFSAAFQSLTGIVHFLLMLRSSRQKILKTASSWGKAPLALVTLRKLDPEREERLSAYRRPP
jgi:hypothetical protein